MTELHFTRFRGNAQKDFFDPASDLLTVFPTAVRCALNMTGLKDDAEIDADYLISCWRVFELRLHEDTTPVTDQVDAFLEALKKVPEERLRDFYAFLTKSLFCAYALFLRSQAELKRSELSRMFTFAELGALKDRLSAETFAAVKKELGDSLPTRTANAPVTDGSVTDSEGNVVIDNVKVVASCLMPATGDRTWDAMAKAADEWFEKRSGKEALALALAYPTYESPYMQATMPEEELHAD